MKNSILHTEDGSSTIYSESVDDTYHSIHGAITESKMVYIENGFCYTADIFKEEIRVFEVGFGTGLNAFLTAIECQNRNTKVYYHAVEAFPVDFSLIQNLNYSKIVNQDTSHSIFVNMHNCNWDKKVKINEFFSLYKEHGKLEGVKIIPNSYNLVYYDAFGPSKQSEMWTFEMIEKVCLGIQKKGVFVTYSTCGELKRMLVKLGFNIEKLQGPPGKREVLRAVKI